MFDERFQMSAQIIEFPMNRVRNAQPVESVSGTKSSRAVRRPSVRKLSRPVLLVRAALGWALILVVSVGLLLGVGKQIESAQATSAPLTSQDAVKFEYITVMSGDNLWGIAQQYAPDRDPREFIAEIVALNNMSDSVVDAGMRIALPIK
jgi:hypothetical protein